MINLNIWDVNKVIVILKLILYFVHQKFTVGKVMQEDLHELISQ